MSYEPYIRFYADEERTLEVASLQFKGITLVGTSKTLEIWAVNVCKYELVNITISVRDPDVIVEPKMIPLLNPNGVSKLTFIFTPSPSRTEPLNTEFKVECVMVKRV